MRALSGYLVPVLEGGRAEAPPRPWRTAAIYTALALLSLAVGYPAGMPWPEVAIAPVSLLLLGFMQTLISWDQLLQRRRSADQWIRFKPRLLGPMDVWREQELTSSRERRSLARSVRGIVDEINARCLPSAAPLNRAALRPYSPQLTELADRLADVGRPVSGCGILHLRDLLSDGGSPLYYGGDPEGLETALGRVRAELEVD